MRRSPRRGRKLRRGATLALAVVAVAAACSAGRRRIGTTTVSLPANLQVRPGESVVIHTGSGTSTDKEVYLTGDRSVLYEDLYDVFDRLKDAGVEKVGLVAKAPGER